MKNRGKNDAVISWEPDLYQIETLAKIRQSMGPFTSRWLFCYPTENEKLLELLQHNAAHGGSSVTEAIIRLIEQETATCLKKCGLPSDIKKLDAIKRTSLREIEQGFFETALNVTTLSAIEALHSAKRLRGLLTTKRAEEVMLETLRFLSAALTAQAHDIAVRGVRHRVGSPKGGQAEKHKAGILGLIKAILQEPRHRRASAQKIWDMIVHRHDGEDRAADIDGYRVFYDEIENKVTQTSPRGKTEGIGFDAFKKHVARARREFLDK